MLIGGSQHAHSGHDYRSRITMGDTARSFAGRRCSAHGGPRLLRDLCEPAWAGPEPPYRNTCRTLAMTDGGIGPIQSELSDHPPHQTCHHNNTYRLTRGASVRFARTAL